MDRLPGRVVFVFANRERTEPRGYEARWPGYAMFADGGCVAEIDNSPHIDDWPDGIRNTTPGPGVWVWAGDIVWTGGGEYDEWDNRGEGSWRRPNAAETWALMRGAVPWADAKESTP